MVQFLGQTFFTPVSCFIKIADVQQGCVTKIGPSSTASLEPCQIFNMEQ